MDISISLLNIRENRTDKGGYEDLIINRFLPNKRISILLEIGPKPARGSRVTSYLATTNDHDDGIKFSKLLVSARRIRPDA